MASLFRSYQSFLARKPLLGNVVTCGVSFLPIYPPSLAQPGLSDTSSRFPSSEADHVDPVRYW